MSTLGRWPLDSLCLPHPTVSVLLWASLLLTSSGPAVHFVGYEWDGSELCLGGWGRWKHFCYNLFKRKAEPFFLGEGGRTD